MYRRFQHANGVDNTEQHPFVPRSDVDNAFYNHPQPQYSYDYAGWSLGGSPLRSGSHDLVSPRESVFQMSGGGGSSNHRSSHHRSSSHSPSRHGSSSHRSSSHHRRPPTQRATAPATYVVPQSAPVRSSSHHHRSPTVPQNEPVKQQYAPAPAYVDVVPRGKHVQIISPQYTPPYTAAPEEHRGSLLQRSLVTSAEPPLHITTAISMTEYDYSEEGYRRFQQTQNRTANWVDKTDQHAPQFKSPLCPPLRPRQPVAWQLAPALRLVGGRGRSFTPPRHRSSHHRSSSYSPSRHGSSSYHRSPTHHATAPDTYVVPQSAPVKQQYTLFKQQYAPVPAYVIVPRHGKHVQIVYPEEPKYPTHYTAVPEEHRGSLLQRISGSHNRSSSRPRSSRR
ncbi:hypothetical protein C8J57DRAFT_1513264 [Mycena rebaudengoi]|nr:hypothetical protein C8J57DRAFT_1513264 [Mycena rebaudengoi]